MRAESPRQKHHIAAPHTYLSNAMKRAVGALERSGGFTIPGAVPQADIKRAFGPKLTARPHHQPLTHFQSHPASPGRAEKRCAWPRSSSDYSSLAERWLSGLRHTPGKRAWLKPTEGSNPSLSASCRFRIRRSVHFLASGVTFTTTRWPSRNTVISTGWPIFTASSA